MIILIGVSSTPIAIFGYNLPQVLHFASQKMLTFLSAFPPRALMHFLALEELPRADFRVFLHLLFSLEHVFFNFLQFELLVILLGNESLQALTKRRKEKSILNYRY